MRRNIQTQCALAVTTFGLALTAKASPFPQRGYIINGLTFGGVNANIGRRSSTEAAQRAALRMFARLVRWYPHKTGFGVDWQTIDAQGRLKQTWSSFDDRPTEHLFIVDNSIFYQQVTKRIIVKVARRNGTFRDLTRYNVVNVSEPVEIDLGTRTSYDAGNRATVRTLASRLLQTPFNAEYFIRWNYLLPDRRTAEIVVNYNPAFDGGVFEVDRSINGSDPDSHSELWGISYQSVSKRAIIVVGRRSGTFKDLTRFGAKGYRKEN